MSVKNQGLSPDAAIKISAELAAAIKGGPSKPQPVVALHYDDYLLNLQKIRGGGSHSVNDRPWECK